MLLEKRDKNIPLQTVEKPPKVKHKVWVKPFQRLAVSKGRAFGRSPKRAKYSSTKNAATVAAPQEGRQNSPVDCFVVGNPRRGFPVSSVRTMAANRFVQCIN